MFNVYFNYMSAIIHLEPAPLEIPTYEERLKVGLYHSALDWSFPGYFEPEAYPESVEAMVQNFHDQVNPEISGPDSAHVRCGGPLLITPSERHLSCDVAVIGGVAADLAAARWGNRVILTEETDWIGGPITSQAVPPDEHHWIEHHGTTRLCRDLRRRIRDYIPPELSPHPRGAS